MMRRRLALTAAAAALTLTACDSQPVDDLSTRTSVAPPLGATPTLAADPTRAEATEMAEPTSEERKDIKVYVAMGDSYASMGSASGENADPTFCANSKDNYPSELADILGDSVTFVDASCQGSATENISGRRIQPRDDVDLDPQIDKLRRDTDLVTLSLGGNDLDFAGVARCVNAMLDGEDINCANEYALPTAQRLAELPGRLAKVHADIHAKAPNATVVVTGYMPLLSTQQRCELTDTVGAESVEWVVWLTAAINNIVKQTAETNGAIYVLPDDTERHTSCASPKQRWVSVDGDETNSYPAHPTPAGQEKMADTIAAAIGR